MINKIFARAFKGLSFDEEIGKYTLLVGPNGSGKTARIQALTLAILGYLPSDQAKQPGAIYATHATGKEMIVAFQVGENRFARKYLRENGTVSHSCGLNGKAIPQKHIDRTLIALGSPRIFDLREFNELSEQKKIDLLLRLSPPSGDLAKLDMELFTTDEKIKKLQADMRGKKNTIEQLTEARAGITLPSGTLAGIQAEIKAKEQDIEKAQDELKASELAEQKRIAELESEKKALEAKQEGRQEVKQEIQGEMVDLFKRAEQAQEELKEVRASLGRNEAALDKAMKEAAEKFRPDCLESLKKIKETLESSGCEVCAALLVLKLEMKKFRS